MKAPVLNDEQLLWLCMNTPELEQFEGKISHELASRLNILQIRAGNAYQAGAWEVENTNEKITFENASIPPTQQETQQLFKEIYIQLPFAEREQLQTIANEMDLGSLITWQSLVLHAPKNALRAAGIGK